MPWLEAFLDLSLIYETHWSKNEIKWKMKKFDGIKTRSGNKDIEEFRESGVYAPTEFYILTSWEDKQEQEDGQIYP